MKDDLLAEVIEEVLPPVEDRFFEGDDGEPGALFALLWRALYDFSWRSG